jgi:hypothetical protein
MHDEIKLTNAQCVIVKLDHLQIIGYKDNLCDLI